MAEVSGDTGMAGAGAGREKIMKHFILGIIAAFWLTGCAAHTENPNARMMNNVMGELDRETAK